MLELTPTLDESADAPLFVQLYRYLRAELLSGAIPPGTRLPSIRGLAAHLRLSRTPVAQAYEQLQAEGYLHSRPRSGYYASQLQERSPAIRESPSRTSAPLHTYHARHSDPIEYDFGYGSVDTSQFPISRWHRWLSRCMKQDGGRLLLYGELQGEPELRREIAAYLHQMRGVRCSPDQIVIGAGTYHSLDLLFQLLEGEVQRLAAEEAVNEGIRALLARFRFDCHPLCLEDDGIRIEEVVESGAQAVYVTPSHQFPYGMTLSAGKRLQLLDWASHSGSLIIENDYDGEFRYGGGRPIPSLQSMDETGSVVYIGTFSRVLTPAIRISYMVLPPRLLDKFGAFAQRYDQLASPIFQHALSEFMASGDLSRHIRRMRALYQTKQQAITSRIASLLGEQMDMIGAASGLHLLLRDHRSRSEHDLIERARQHGVSVYPVSPYALLPERAAEGTVLLGYGGLTVSQIGEGVSRLADAWS